MTTMKPVPAIAPVIARKMAEAAQGFLDTLDAASREAAVFDFNSDERYEWTYVPAERNGLRLRSMNERQRDAAFAMMATAYSARGFATARQVIQLETILGEWESIQKTPSQWERSPDRYWFSVFGVPGSDKPWGFRVGGHHIGLTATVVNGELVTTNPLFLGANPAEVRHGDHKGLRTLAAEEDLARDLLGSLSDEQKKKATVDAVAPSDILTKTYRVADPNATPTGISFAQLSDAQRDKLVKLVRHYVTRSNETVAENYWRHIESVGTDRWTFAWAGPEARGQGHYYAVQAPIFVIEYDNTQNGANHIHSVLRDYADDWGEDLLAAHYGKSHH